MAITGGTGLVGRHLAQRLVTQGHEVVAIGSGTRKGRPHLPPQVTVVESDIADVQRLAEAFRGCSAVAHCAGINRELGRQTYAAVHVDGTRAVVEAAHEAGVERLVMLSFLRARPDGPSEYHRSKWLAEERIRGSGLTWTVLKAGVIHGRGDHMLDPQPCVLQLPRVRPGRAARTTRATGRCRRCRRHPRRCADGRHATCRSDGGRARA
ncbi:MAG: NAD(P)H-binding protein, partial [Chloroflexi bacterium]|nr:NAD(P)H-binding protein [Chloroflexota bacterium]